MRNPDINDGTFGPTTISGLESGSSYNLIVMATESRDGQEQRRITQPVVIVAP